jgi:hypothetical protein
MGADFSKFKTPFFKVKIGDSKSKPENMINLPHHILRLVSKVEITETFEEGQFNTINITFIEGSREPASPDAELGTSGLYKISNNIDGGGGADLDVAGSLTNRTGIIADLRFSGTGGITFLTKQEQKKNAIDTRLQKNVNDDSTTRAYPREQSKPTLLFQERNKVAVTWGYLEDPSSVRTIMGYIMLVNVKYPDNGQVETNITIHDTNSALDQLALDKGVAFGTKINTPAGNSITKFEDVITQDLIRDICNKSGIPCIISPNLPFPTLDTDRQKIWLAGESFKQFMDRLAKQENAYFKVTPNPTTGIDTLYFINKTDFENKVVIPKSFLTYKGPNSILKKAEVTVDFGGIQGSSKVGVDLEGKNTKVSSQTGGVNISVFEGQKSIVDNNPISEMNPILAAEGIFNYAVNVNSLGPKTLIENSVKWTPPKCEVTPYENPQKKQDSAEVDAASSSRQIQLNFTTIGFTKLTPGTVELSGLGVRYSGKYRVITVSHKITSSGYETECRALSMAMTAGGILDPQALVEKDKERDQVDIKLMESQKESDIRAEYEKAYGVPK